MKLMITLCLSSCSSYKMLDLTKHKIEATKKYKITDSNETSISANNCLRLNDTLKLKNWS